MDFAVRQISDARWAVYVLDVKLVCPRISVVAVIVASERCAAWERGRAESMALITSGCGSLAKRGRSATPRSSGRGACCEEGQDAETQTQSNGSARRTAWNGQAQ